MKLLLLGSGGREHALAWKIAQSPKIEKLYIAPGNAGTSEVGENVAIKADDFAAIKEFVVKNDINMVAVSYTHLDVYKRQDTDFGRFKRQCSSGKYNCCCKQQINVSCCIG